MKSPPPAPLPSAASPWQAMASWPAWFGPVLLAVAVSAAYATSLVAPFFFDDVPNIEFNPTIHGLWSSLSPPGGGYGVAGRPVVNLSFALNYALGGNAVWGYHLFNLLIHFAAALVLGGIVRRTFLLPWAPAQLREAARPLGFATALLWALHPLQTESVTFIVQRTESLAGLIYLLVLYCFIRGATGEASAARRWFVLGGAACFIGVATKETMATVPLIVLLYDRTFLAGTFRGAWQQRRWFYTALVLSWVLLAGLMLQTHDRGGTVLVGRGVSVWLSLLTQSRAVVMYLGLAVWPHPLVVDYGDLATEIVPDLAAVWPQFIFLTALFGGTVLALVRWPRWGFLGAWFFVILAPSSSFIPLLSQVRAEHRMYLPLAAVVVLVVLLLQRLAGRAAPLLVAALAGVLGVATVARNYDYRSAQDLWADTVAKQPGNPRAHYGLALELSRSGDDAGAIRENEEALRLEPDYLDAHIDLAELLLDEHRLAEARPHIEAAVRLTPDSSNGNNSLGQLLLLTDEPQKAQPYFETALQLDPENFEAHNNLGYLLAAAGRTAEAIAHFQRSVALHPTPSALANLGEALLKLGQSGEAITVFGQAVRLRPDFTDARLGLAEALIAAGRKAEAVGNLRLVLAQEKDNARAAEMLRRLGAGP